MNKTLVLDIFSCMYVRNNLCKLLDKFYAIFNEYPNSIFVHPDDIDSVFSTSTLAWYKNKSCISLYLDSFRVVKGSPVIASNNIYAKQDGTDHMYFLNPFTVEYFKKVKKFSQQEKQNRVAKHLQQSISRNNKSENLTLQIITS